MRIFVVSDTHGNIKDFTYYVKSMEEPDLIIHLGDYIEDAVQIEKLLKVDTIKVKGNCDYFMPKVKEEEILSIKGKKIFITHGHKYGAKLGVHRLFYRGLEVGADIVLYGHTHFPSIVREEGMIILNPGSPSMPRGSNKKTFAVISIESDIKTEIIEIN